MDKYFPFELEGDGAISAMIEEESLYPLYYEVFQKHGYEGNGYCWEGHIVQILEQRDPPLLQHIRFDPEAGAFFAYADSENAQQQFAELLSPVFSKPATLEMWIEKADRSRIDD